MQTTTPNQTQDQTTTGHHHTRGTWHMNTIKITMLAACLGLGMTALDAHALRGQNGLAPNALRPQWPEHACHPLASTGSRAAQRALTLAEREPPGP